MDLFNNEIVAYKLYNHQQTSLVIDTLKAALVARNNPEGVIIHSDQGSEYKSNSYRDLAQEMNIQISFSDKGSPWQNGHIESFFGRFKEESGDLNRFESLAEFIANIYQQIYYYNNQRIHTKLKMSPVQFKHRTRRKLS